MHASRYRSEQVRGPCGSRLCGMVSRRGRSMCSDAMQCCIDKGSMEKESTARAPQKRPLRYMLHTPAGTRAHAAAYTAHAAAYAAHRAAVRLSCPAARPSLGGHQDAKDRHPPLPRTPRSPAQTITCDMQTRTSIDSCTAANAPRSTAGGHVRRHDAAPAPPTLPPPEGGRRAHGVRGPREATCTDE